MTADELVALNEQIAAMARAGLPLDQGLESLAVDMGRGRLRDATEHLAKNLRAGRPLPAALDELKGKVPPYYPTLMKAGVLTGKLPEVLTTLTMYARTTAATRATVVEALLYPSIVLFIGLLLFGFAGALIVPIFENIYGEFGLMLPWATQWVLFIGRHSLVILAVVAVLVLAPTAAWLMMRTTPRGKRIGARLLLQVPLVGPVVRSARLAAFTDLLSILVDNRVPLPEAFRLAGAAAGDAVMEDRAAAVAGALEQGQPMSDALRVGRIVPDWVAWLAASGERQGGLAGSLREIAALYRRQVELRSSVLRTVLPPLIVICSAIFLAFFFVLLLLLPMIRLLEGLSR